MTLTFYFFFQALINDEDGSSQERRILFQAVNEIYDWEVVKVVDKDLNSTANRFIFIGRLDDAWRIHANIY